MNIVGLYPNIPHEEAFKPELTIKRLIRLETRKEKYVLTDTIMDLAEVVLKINTFTFGKKTLKQKLLVQNLHLRLAFYLRQN